MTSAEALADLRGLLHEMRLRPPADRSEPDVLWQSIREVLNDGVDPVIELRIRHLRRRAGMRATFRP